MLIEKESLESVKDYLNNKSVLITGATGFVGKYIVYKLLKCFHVNAIFFIVRAKKGKSVQKRFEEYLKSKTFSEINENILLEKLVALEGDITLPKLGLSDDHYQTVINNVSVVINSGASIKYNDTLR
ncbi:hypothetical protein B4U80_10365 [Leptotrombidium deliense]|uniref:Fatty acyl-CoA reductase n=1 Tax=Leptotrombidium deliense TaxID=299467 RepID=A0A443STC0_9ACAR|nr:hypothetical protein B4U80_10365 [Leptotrombidium deliense]